MRKLRGHDCAGIQTGWSQTGSSPNADKPLGKRQGLGFFPPLLPMQETS